MKRLHVLFNGHVQGVGFRYSVRHYASSYVITGFVRNLHDGQVELVAEGEQKELSGFLKGICSGPLNNYIRNYDENWSDALGTFSDFRIKLA